jgi:hypothetical protein
LNRERGRLKSREMELNYKSSSALRFINQYNALGGICNHSRQANGFKIL